MTDRVAFLSVALDQNYRTDDVEAIVNAISQIRGVLTVRHGPAVSGNDWAAEERIRRELILSLIEQLKTS